MRLLVLAAVAAVLAMPTAEAADGETCRGLPATIVQTDGVVEGTDGDDVIVGGSLTTVRAGDGRDTICVTGGRVNGGEGRDSIEVRGSEGDDLLSLDSVEDLDVEMGSGADRVRLDVGDGSRLAGHLDGGADRDLVSVNADWGVTIDLASERLVLRPRQLAALTGFEDAAQANSGSGSIIGDAEDNRLWFGTSYDCGGVVYGGPGDDRIVARRMDTHDSCIGLTAYGQAGNDVMIGSYDPDELYGGPGRDRAYGRDDSDYCRAEVRRSCELKRPYYG